MAGSHYFQDELRYLREVGPEFARAHPELARTLGNPGSDPDVERLLEGVAFLCGRIREKLDDELPELTASMMSLLWPHYLRPIPSMTILEMLPDIQGMQTPLDVAAGAAFASDPVAETKTACVYSSCWPVRIRPWQMERVELRTVESEPARLILRLHTSAKVSLDALELDAVPLYLAGDPMTSFTLYWLLSAHVSEVVVSNGESGSNRREATLPKQSVGPAGLDSQSGVLPYPPNSFVGYRLLQEYLAFKERFLFIDIRDLHGAVTQLELTDRLELSITFDRRLDSYPRVTADNVRLHCVPTLNLFEHDAVPIPLKHDRTQYLIRPEKTGSMERDHIGIYSIGEVSGTALGAMGESKPYKPFYSFDHSSVHSARYFQTHFAGKASRTDANAGADIYISLVTGAAPSQLPAAETVSIDLVCTNQGLPAKLRAGDICRVTDTSPPGVPFRNITKPTPTIPPPWNRGLHWRLISHMSLNYVSLANTAEFRELLRVYDFQSEYDAQRAQAHERLLGGILEVTSSFEECLIRGALARGTKVSVNLDESKFAGEGDAYLFAVILDRFMALYATVNAFSRLTVRLDRSGLEYTFPVRWGEQLSPAKSRSSA